MIRQTVLLRRILGYFATPTQLREYDSLVLKNKGSACHLGMRLIERYFDHRDRKEHPERYRKDFLQDKSSNGDAIKINSKEGSFYL